MPVLHRVVPVTVYGAAPPSLADSVPIPRCLPFYRGGAIRCTVCRHACLFEARSGTSGPSQSHDTDLL